MRVLSELGKGLALAFAVTGLSSLLVLPAAAAIHQEMAPVSLMDYASSKNLSDEELITLEILTDGVRWKVDGNSWELVDRLKLARKKPGYKPTFKIEEFRRFAPELERLDWLSLQVISDERPVRDIKALGYLPNLAGLVLSGSEVQDLDPLRRCPKLERLNLAKMKVKDLSPLEGCGELAELNLSDAEIGDLSVLEKLSGLKELSISISQLPQFQKLGKLPSLERLEISGDEMESFEGFPDMPKLRTIRGADVRSLSGIEKFPSLESLVNFAGPFDSLEPLSALTRLTHVGILESRVRSLAPVAELLELRVLRLETEFNLDVSELRKLPKLREVSVRNGDNEVPGLQELRAGLTSWDVEFLADSPRTTPSLRLEIVDQETFDHYDIKERYGISKDEIGSSMLDSELDWLDTRLDKVFGLLKEDDDYAIPFKWPGGRSRTVVIYSERAAKAFPTLVKDMQTVLGTAKKDWILYFQSDGLDEDFIVWVYPDRIVTTQEYADTVRRLIGRSKKSPE